MSPSANAAAALGMAFCPAAECLLTLMTAIFQLFPDYSMGTLADRDYHCYFNFFFFLRFIQAGTQARGMVLPTFRACLSLINPM